MKICIDTNAYRHFLENNAAVVEILENAGSIFVPVTVLGELFAGFRLGSRYKFNCKVLDEFLSEESVEVIDITTDIARRYGEIVAQLKNKATPIPTNDIWIAAATFETGSHLLTYDTHFNQVPGLSVVGL